MRKIAVFASGTGTNFDAIQKAIEDKYLDAVIECVVVDKKNALVIEKAKKKNIYVFDFNPKDYESKAAYEKEIVELLDSKEIELVCLAGYMRLVGETLLNAYEGRIINIHPSLIPSFCGSGMYGIHVHEAAFARGVKVSDGCNNSLCRQWYG